jgi:hypothetical protein
MRNRLQCFLRTLAVGWLWLAVLLVLPACDRVFDISEVPDSIPNLDQGTPPRTLPIFCDIESAKQVGHCASDDEVTTLLSRSHAAIDLVTGQAGGNAALDYSAAARNELGCGATPVVVPFDTSFPQGSPVCVKYLDIIGPGLAYENPNGVCIAMCEDLNGSSKNSPSTTVTAFCTQHAHVSTNYPLGEPTLFGFGGFQGGCTAEGVLQSNFDDPMQPALIDPRRIAEPVAWQHLQGVAIGGGASNTLTRTAATTTNFDAGAASVQTITTGDAYVQFTATETNLARLGGLSIGSANSDTNPNFNNINFAIDLFADGQFYVFEKGQIVQAGTSGAAFGTYAAGDRFRVNVKDNFDGTATITYSRLVGPCTPGTPCSENVFYTSAVSASYPLYADSSFKEQGATLDDVRLVRIH